MEEQKRPERKEEIRKAEENKKSTHVGSKAAGTLLILALLGGGGYFGLGIGNPSGGWLNPQTPSATQEAATSGRETTAATQAAPATEAPTTTEEGVLSLTVKEGEILYQGRAVTLAQLEESLLSDYKEGFRVRLVDDHAVKSVYEEVSTLLEKLRVTLETATP